MKRKGNIEIGKRAAREAYRLYPDESTVGICRKLGCNRKLLGDWQAGVSPSALLLARLCELGGDVIWILTGKRRCPEPTPDFLAELEEEYD